MEAENAFETRGLRGQKILQNSNLKNVTQVLLPRHSVAVNLFFKGQFWGRAALAPVDLSQDPGALFCAESFCLKSIFLRFNFFIVFIQSNKLATKPYPASSCILTVSLRLGVNDFFRMYKDVQI